MKRQTGIRPGASYDRNGQRANRTHKPLIMIGEINIFNPTHSPKNKSPKEPKRNKTVIKKGRRENDSPYLDTDQNPSLKGLTPTPLNLSQFNFNKRHHSIGGNTISLLKDQNSSIGGLMLPVDLSSITIQ